MTTSAADLFLLIAGTCAIVLTLVCLVIAFFVIRAVLEIQAVVRTVNRELESFREARIRNVRKIRFASRWVRLFLERLF